MFPIGAAAVAIRSPLPANADGFARHDRADFAQEFLRRNAAYRAGWARVHGAARVLGGSDLEIDLAGRWGLVRMFDPDQPVRAQPALWRLDCASQIVALVPAPPGLHGAARLPDLATTAERLSGDTRDVVLDLAGVRHRLHIAGADSGGHVAIALPPHGDPLRIAACDAARRMFARQSVAESARSLRPSSLQRQRLTLLLRALDASIAGASIREIGTSLVYPWLAGIDAAAWKAASERRRVQRLVAEARELSAKGYRTLLSG